MVRKEEKEKRTWPEATAADGKLTKKNINTNVTPNVQPTGAAKRGEVSRFVIF